MQAKPLSLEYMADRLDVDDPLFGYIAVSTDKSWLQGCAGRTRHTHPCTSAPQPLRPASARPVSPVSRAP